MHIIHMDVHAHTHKLWKWWINRIDRHDSFSKDLNHIILPCLPSSGYYHVPSVSRRPRKWTCSILNTDYRRGEKIKNKCWKQEVNQHYVSGFVLSVRCQWTHNVFSDGYGWAEKRHERKRGTEKSSEEEVEKPMKEREALRKAVKKK